MPRDELSYKADSSSFKKANKNKHTLQEDEKIYGIQKSKKKKTTKRKN